MTAVQDAPASDAASTPRDASATVANLSAEIAQKAGGQTTRFDVQLDPVGLGRVNVSVEIDAKGAMSAALSFEKPEAASLLRAHAGDLQQSLAQAGFNLSDAALSFSTTQDGRGAANQNASAGGGGQQFQNGQPQSGQTQNGQPQNGQFQNGQPQNGQPQNGQPQNGQSQTAGRAFGAAGLAADQADRIATTARIFNARGLDMRI
jgi:flagellar hook-length control protein FliK